LVHGYLDGELDAARASEFEKHLQSCSQCVAELEAQDGLRSSIRGAHLYEKAPASLRKKVLKDIKGETSQKAGWFFPRLTWAAVAACAVFLLLIFAGWRQFTGGRNETLLAKELVDDHIRSLQPGHLTDVVSSDQHTVKPWFDGKIDFAPPVRDFAAQDFPLVGGRLEVINGHSVAAMVYGRRKHFINVFVWPSHDSADMKSGSVQGYNWAQWQNGEFEMWAVSDASAADLEALRRLFQSP
jgi:mycothiol system anti-sigma-R factor